MDSVAEIGHASVIDWQEECYQKLQYMKEQYLTDFTELHQRVETKYKQEEAHIQKQSEQNEKLKTIKTLLGSMLTFLQISKDNIPVGTEEKLHTYEEQIFLMVAAHRAKKTTLRTQGLVEVRDPNVANPHPTAQQQPQVSRSRLLANQMQQRSVQPSGSLLQSSEPLSMLSNNLGRPAGLRQSNASGVMQVSNLQNMSGISESPENNSMGQGAQAEIANAQSPMQGRQQQQKITSQHQLQKQQQLQNALAYQYQLQQQTLNCKMQQSSHLRQQQQTFLPQNEQQSTQVSVMQISSSLHSNQSNILQMQAASTLSAPRPRLQENKLNQIQQSVPSLIQQNSQSVVREQQAQTQHQWTTSLQQQQQQQLSWPSQLQQQFAIQHQSNFLQWETQQRLQASMDSTAQRGHAGVIDWQEQCYQKVKSMKAEYFTELTELHETIALQQQETLVCIGKQSEQHEKSKHFRTMVERFIAFLHLSKSSIPMGIKDKFPMYEKQIILIITSHRASKSALQEQSRQQFQCPNVGNILPTQQQHPPQTSQLQLPGNHAEQTQQMDVQGSGTSSQPSGFPVNDPVSASCLNSLNKRPRIPANRSTINCERSSISEHDSSTKRTKLSEPVPEKESMKEPTFSCHICMDGGEKQKEPTFSCPICMCVLASPFSTVCGHIFCEVCIKAAIKRRKECPTCRTKLMGRNNIHRVYLPTAD